MKGRVLIIAGSDSGGGAGIQADIKTVTILGGYAMTAITAITIQDTQKVHGVFPIPPDTVARQMEVVLDDLGADALKTGMLHDAPLIEAIVSALESKAANIPLVVDPVMVAKGGEALLEESALNALKTKLLPRAALITPNIPEAERLLNQKIGSVGEMPDAAKALGDLGSKAVLLKGGHMPGSEVVDVLWDGIEITSWKSPRITSTSTHGTGCTLASAIATGIAQKRDLKEAIARAREYVASAITHAIKLGHGHGPLNHNWKAE
jgi:hydroxymethylpyrimidine/phosphomethylpyrimidine kinase